MLISFVDLKVKHEKYMYIIFKALLDSGESCNLAFDAAVPHLKKTKNDVTSFKKDTGNFSTNQKCRTKMTLADFNPTADFTHSVHIAKTLGNYDIIIGQDLLHELGIDIRFCTKTMCWNDNKVDMKHLHAQKKTCSTWRKNCLYQTKWITLQKY